MASRCSRPISTAGTRTPPRIAMFKQHLHSSDLPLLSKDLEICQRVFERPIAQPRLKNRMTLSSSQKSIEFLSRMQRILSKNTAPIARRRIRLLGELPPKPTFAAPPTSVTVDLVAVARDLHESNLLGNETTASRLAPVPAVPGRQKAKPRTPQDRCDKT